MKTYELLALRSVTRREEDKRFNSILLGHNLTASEWMVLGHVYEKDQQVSALAKYMDTSMAFMTNTVNALESKSWVERSMHKRDNRARVVKFTGNKNLFKKLESELQKVVTDED